MRTWLSILPLDHPREVSGRRGVAVYRVRPLPAARIFGRQPGEALPEWSPWFSCDNPPLENARIAWLIGAVSVQHVTSIGGQARYATLLHPPSRFYFHRLIAGKHVGYGGGGRIGADREAHPDEDRAEPGTFGADVAWPDLPMIVRVASAYHFAYAESL